MIISYPDYDELLRLLAKYVGTQKTNLVLTNGADQAIDLVLRLFFNDNSRVLIPSPVFSVYYHFLKILGSEIIPVYYKDKDNHFEFPFEETLSIIEDEDIDGLILVNPNNPLSSLIPHSYIKSLIKITYDKDIPLILDEAYFEFSDITYANYVRKYSNLIIIRTFSKFFGLAGLRIGYVIANESVRDSLIKLAGPWNVNSCAIHFTTKILETPSYLKELYSTRDSIVNYKQKLYQLFEQSGVDYYSSFTNFVVIRHNDYKRIYKGLYDKKIIINDISNHPYSHNLLKDSLRITIPINEDFDVFKKYFLEVMSYVY